MHVWESFLKVNGWDSDYESIAKILRYYKRKIQSEGTRANVCQILKSFCVFAGKNPDEIVGLGVEDASRLVQDYVGSLAERGISIRYVNGSMAFLKTFFKVNGFKEGKSLQVERHYQPPRYRKTGEYIPTSAEIYNMSLASGSARNKAVILTLYTSGLRNSTLRALLYRDIVDEIEKGAKVIRLPVYPEMKKIDAGACKGNIPYYSFMSAEAADAVREYFAERIKPIEGDEPLFASESTNVPREVGRHTPLMKKSLEAMVKRAARKAGLKRWQDVRPHCLRKAFEYALLNGGLDPKDQEFLMGHILPRTQDPYYDSSKVEDLRAKYQRIDFFRTRHYDKLEMIKDFAKTLGIDKIDIKIQKLREEQPELEEVDAIGRVMREELGINPMKIKMAKFRKDDEKADCSDGKCRKYETRIVAEKELVSHLDRGWALVKELRSGKIVVKRLL